MKLMLVGLVVLSGASFGSGFAHAGTNIQACKNMKQACEAGGYTKGGSDGKDLVKDCFGRIKNGEPVVGVSFSQSDAERCHDTIASKKAKKAQIRNEPRMIK